MTTTQRLPSLDPKRIGPTRDALHAYARGLGAWLKACRPKRRHWWHASLRPSLTGLTTGVVQARPRFELELNLRDSRLIARSGDGAELAESLHGQPAAELAQRLNAFLIASGVDERLVPAVDEGSDSRFEGYAAEHARRLAQVLSAVSGAMAEFRAGIAEETSPVQLWPHHFDLSMLWLPGEKIAGQDPADEENSDKQMNFGFTFGDAGIPEPYFYVTAYPLPDGFARLRLPAGSRWHTAGFKGAVLPYQSLVESADPKAYLLELWAGMLSAGREQMLEQAN